jgi:hypothetical protein
MERLPVSTQSARYGGFVGRERTLPPKTKCLMEPRAALGIRLGLYLCGRASRTDVLTLLDGLTCEKMLTLLIHIPRMHITWCREYRVSKNMMNSCLLDLMAWSSGDVSSDCGSMQHSHISTHYLLDDSFNKPYPQT